TVPRAVRHARPAGGDARVPGQARASVRGTAGVRVRTATPADLPSLLMLLEELDRMQRDWRVFTPRPGVYAEIGRKYRAAMHDPDALVAVAEDSLEVVGMATAEVRIPSRFSDERTLELSP